MDSPELADLLMLFMHRVETHKIMTVCSELLPRQASYTFLLKKAASHMALRLHLTLRSGKLS